MSDKSNDRGNETLLHLIEEAMPWSGWGRSVGDKHVLEFVDCIDISTKWTVRFVSGAGVEGRDTPRMLDALMRSIEYSPFVFDVRCIGKDNPPDQVMRIYPVVVAYRERECFDVAGFRKFLDYQIATYTLSGRYHLAQFTAYLAGYRATCVLADLPPRPLGWEYTGASAVEM